MGTTPQPDVKTHHDFVALLSRVGVRGIMPGLVVEVGRSLSAAVPHGSGVQLQRYPHVSWLRVKGEDREEGPWAGRKWYLSPHMTDSEVVQTAFAAVMAAMEHEVREKFRFGNASPFNPHFHVDDLAHLDTVIQSRDIRPGNGAMNPD